MKFVTLQFADVSTSHIKQSDSKLLEQLGRDSPLNFIVVASYEGGFFLSIGTQFSEHDALDIRASGFSKEFANLLIELSRRYVNYLRLDRDGYEVEGAATFEWD